MAWTLLTLPPEMRNLIYRDVLVEGDIYYTHKIDTEPAILRTCRQARSEASRIYYEENRFVFWINNNDVSQLIKWCMSSSSRHRSRMASSVDFSRNWDNLLVWARAVFRGECGALVLEREDGSNQGLFASFHVLDVAMQLRRGGVGWEVAEGVLKQMRMAMATEHQDWALNEV
ncbi:hypothetical protein LTR56_018734 [Elasticomyces elasticus]|nr:hypothetical protein LTR56_018734 [Elasticomyces elasticus]KAK3635961.1 hypothetical protein LTR22_018954 [Elasticomyces elasticus]KAK4911960.1 hypothetical protein LTR49_019522 [Elasticomyces elasticus]KAK5751496.1 hypothetical protein LTS12_018419 [Elasticomyces elasticus]